MTKRQYIPCHICSTAAAYYSNNSGLLIWLFLTVHFFPSFVLALIIGSLGQTLTLLLMYTHQEQKEP